MQHDGGSSPPLRVRPRTLLLRFRPALHHAPAPCRATVHRGSNPPPVVLPPQATLARCLLPPGATVPGATVAAPLVGVVAWRRCYPGAGGGLVGCRPRRTDAAAWTSCYARLLVSPFASLDPVPFHAGRTGATGLALLPWGAAMLQSSGDSPPGVESCAATWLALLRVSPGASGVARTVALDRRDRFVFAALSRRRSGLSQNRHSTRFHRFRLPGVFGRKAFRPVESRGNYRP